MRRRRLIAMLAWATGLATFGATVACAGPLPFRELVIESGRPLRVALDQRTRITRIGQLLTGTLVESVYAYDRVVIAEGARVQGHVARIEPVPRGTRAAAMMGGDFTPSHRIGLQFDTVTLADGTTVPIRTIVSPGAGPASQEVAGAHDDGIVGHARQQVALQARRAASAVKAPGKLARLGHYLVGRLPFHPQYLEAGEAFNAQLVEPVSLGAAEPAPVAPDGTRPPPASVLSARLLTPLDSASTPRGAVVRAALTRPLLSSAHEVILPEGTIVVGKVTLAKSAKGLRRNGQLRFLFESMEVPGRSSETLSASLYSADVGRDQHLVIDQEGGARVTNPKSRFIAPALAGAAAVVAVDYTEISDEGLGALTTEANVAGRGVKGLSGFGLAGVGLALVSRPASIAFGTVGLARAVYVNLLGKGHEVVFPVNTPIQVQLSPGEGSARR